MSLGLPARGQRDTVFGLALLFALVFGIAYAGASWLSGFVPWRVPMALPVDARMPFWPQAAWVYMTISPVLCLAPFVLRTPATMRRMVWAATVATVAGALCFVLLPVDGTALARIARDDSLAFRIADAMNLERNYFPSLHVALAMLCALAYGAHTRVWVRLLLGAWVVAIAVSTVVTAQHFVLDALAGALLALACWRLARARAERSAWLRAAEVELLCLGAFARFSRRHRRYLGISLVVLAAGLPRWRARRLLRTGFAFLQSADDLLDGDRRCDGEPLQVVSGLVRALQDGAFADDDLSLLARAFRDDLLARGGADALGQAVALLQAMQFDRVRVLEQRLLDANALRAQLHDTFRHSLDLMLLAAGARTRADALPALVDALGWCSTVRDLDEDLARGLVNIPREVVAASQLRALRNADAVRADPAVARWLRAEAARAEADLDAADHAIAGLDDAVARRVLAPFARSMRRYLAWFPDRHARGDDQSSAISG